MISHRELLLLLHYNRRTGMFIWRVSRGTQKAGAVAGSLDDGYRRIVIKRKKYRANQLAHFYVTEKWTQLVDHKNRRRADDSWNNLRPATNALNQANKIGASNCGFKGVTKRKNYARWRARIRVDGRLLHLGVFATPKLAHAAYVAAAKKHFGEFARVR